MNNAAAITTSQLSNLQDKVVLISGAAGDIATNLIEQLIPYSPKLVLLDKNTKQLEAIYDQHEQADITIAPFDLLQADNQAFENLSIQINEQFGKLDTFVSLAGTWGAFAPIQHYPIKKWYEVLQINLNSTFMMLQALLPTLRNSMQPEIIYSAHIPANQANSSFLGAVAVTDAALNKLLELIGSENNITIKKAPISLCQGKLSNSHFPGLSQKSLPSIEDIASIYLETMTNPQT